MKLLLPLHLAFLLMSLNFACKTGAQKDHFINSVGINLVKIEAGSFQMGSLNDSGQWDEYPVRKINISQPFYISETEVTIDQYRAFKQEYTSPEVYAPYVTGISWYDAMSFCSWLSEKEGKIYRLPTEAEWEYACRAGTTTSFSSGNSPPNAEKANAWGIKNMHTGVLEWCYDWYGTYSEADTIDPLGRVAAFAKVIRGGLPDDKSVTYDVPVSYYYRSANRASLPPRFIPFGQAVDIDEGAIAQAEFDQFMPGLTGVLFDDAAMEKPLALWRIRYLNSDKISWKDLNDWSAIWKGSITAPTTADINFFAETEDGIKLVINDQVVIDGWGNEKVREGAIQMQEAQKYPLTLAYYKDGGSSFMRLYWSWPNQEKIEIVPEALQFNTQDRDEMKNIFSNALAARINAPSIGFRIVQAELPKTAPLPRERPYVMQGVKQMAINLDQGPDPDKPYFRKRFLLPTPPENTEKKYIDGSGFHPIFYRHNHDPGLEVCPNGDLIMILYTSTYEDEPEVGLMGTRLRFGSDQWDMPSPFIDLADVNDVAPLLWKEHEKLYFFFGNLHLDSTYPFQWTTSDDNGATWVEIMYPYFKGNVGPFTPQPINSAFRDKDGRLYIACDGLGATSVLWASDDDCATWYDPGGRSGGRHTSFVLLKNGDILGMGGKHSDINGYMPKSISEDGGKSWKLSQSPFSSQGTNQRPSIIRLASGRLFMAGDFQRIDGFQPAAIKQRGSYVALSEDEGKNWYIKKVPGAQRHESVDRSKNMRGSTLGYSVAKQAANGMIHLIATMTNPCLHFEFNEAWIYSQADSTVKSDEVLMQSKAKHIGNVTSYQENYRNGALKLVYHVGKGDDGRYLLHGTETWYYENVQKQYEATYHLGKKVGKESYWEINGNKKWEWDHQTSGKSTWMQWWPNGNKKAVSIWKNMKCDGVAKTWDRDGRLLSEFTFKNGKPVDGFGD